jgi:hypothetical protein
VRLAPEADHAVPAAASLHMDLRSVEEHAPKLRAGLSWRRANPCWPRVAPPRTSGDG